MKNENIKEKLNKLVSDKPSNWLEQAKWHEENEDWLDKSALIALKILNTLSSKSIFQKDLAEKIGVSPQYINKVIKGRENLSLETICKIEKALDISLIEVPFFETSQVLNVSTFDESYRITRNFATLIVSENLELQTFSNYQFESEDLAA